MALLLGDTGMVLYGTLKTLNITPYIVEANITAVSIPTTISTGSPQLTWTIDTSVMKPTFSGTNILSYKPVWTFAAGGQNLSGASATIFFQINKNGANYKTGNIATANNNYFTASIIDGSFINGDVIDFYFWTTGTGQTVTYKHNGCLASHVDTGAKNVVDIAFTTNSFISLLPLTGKVRDAWGAGTNFYPTKDTTVPYNRGTVGTFTFPFAQFLSGNRLFVLAGQSSTQFGINQSATFFPWLNGNYYVTSVSYRDFLR